jgi:hypothetical protein
MPKGRQRFRFSLAALFVIVTFSAFSTCCIVTVGRRITLSNVTPDQANQACARTFSPIRFPDTASHIDVRAFFEGVEASFDMEEDDFLEWVKGKWEVEAIDLRTKPEIAQQLTSCAIAFRWPTAVTTAFYYSKIAPRGSGWTVLYDRSRKRGWIHYSPR